METQNDLEIGIGTKEATALKPAKVTVVSAIVEEVGEKKNKKVVFLVKHPEKADPIKISSVKYLKGNQVVTSGTWLNMDEDGLIRKGSALALVLEKVFAKKISDLVAKEFDTDVDEKNYLCIKVY
jgi:hypothetical protein|tara:strand:+ start:650 stop:1024 length:375 start_codon:yes stop_codon:yes gene_type:complete